MIRRFHVWTSIAVLCGSAGVAAAQPADSPITLWWEAPPGTGCPSNEVVLAEVERLLGGKPSATTGRRLFARARVAPEEDGTWKLTLRTEIAGDDGNGERVLHAPSCEGLARAAALIVALGFDPAAVAAQAERAERAASHPPPAAPQAPPAPPTQRPAPPVAPPVRPTAPARVDSSSALRAGVGLGGGGDVGTFSTPAFALQAWGRLRYQRLQLAATAAYRPPHSMPVLDRPDAGGTFTLITGDLSAGYALLTWPRGASLSAGSLELAACGGIEIGQISAEGYGVASPGKGAALWLVPHAGGALTVVFTDALGLRADVGVAVPVAQHRFILERVGVIEAPGAVSGRAGAGVEVHF